MAEIQTSTGSAYFQFPIPSGEEIYNQLMAQIEPELMTSEMPSLAERYKDETAEQKAARQQRYDAAFAEYEKQYAQYATELKDSFSAFKREAVGTLETLVRNHEEHPVLTMLEQKFA